MRRLTQRKHRVRQNHVKRYAGHHADPHRESRVVHQNLPMDESWHGETKYSGLCHSVPAFPLSASAMQCRPTSTPSNLSLTAS